MVKISPIVSSLKTLTIALQTAQETFQGSPTTLPTSEPSAGNEQISYTVQAGDLPTFNMVPSSKVWIAIIFGCGKFVTAGTLYWRMKKNGASVATGSNTVAANFFYTREFYFFDVAVGDVLKISLWSNKADSNWDYNSYIIYPSRVNVSAKKRLLANVIFTSFAGLTLALGNPVMVQELYPWWICDDNYGALPLSAGKTFVAYYAGATKGLYQMNYGDYYLANDSSSRTHASDRPRYFKHMIPAVVNYRFLDTGTV